MPPLTLLLAESIGLLLLIFSASTAMNKKAMAAAASELAQIAACVDWRRGASEK